MNRTIGYCLLMMFATAAFIVALVRPAWISDQNTFLADFVNHEFLNILGVILAITLASTANIHLAFNRIEERYQTPGGLTKSRQNLTKSTYWLIGLFIAAVALVVAKPVVCQGETAQGLFNAAALLILLWHVLVLVSLTQLVFRIEPDFSGVKKRDDSQDE
ncbi:hypothetical protein [Mesorhizobium sp. CAU 1741]|uniref:hypothetical protein n=1 Tax=Mesorhizobium sp. CAU 1741 TaxID=3140366 RepID=UPI00325AC9B2